jgi:hypothetical protein
MRDFMARSRRRGDRRKSVVSNYQGPERRSGIDRRSGKDRRKDGKYF